MSHRPLTPQQRRFCEAYARGATATDAYKEAGYTCTRASARTRSSALLGKPTIQAELRRLREATEDAAILTIKEAQSILTEIARNPAEETAHRIKAATEVAKMRGGYVEKQQVEQDITIRVVTDDYDGE